MTQKEQKTLEMLLTLTLTVSQTNHIDYRYLKTYKVGCN